MSQRDIDLALALLRRQLPHLRLPARIKSQGFPSHSRCLGQYRYLSDTLKLNERYLAPLDNAGALDLLDTLIHELLHKNSRWTRQVRDTLFRHPEIHAEAARLTRHLAHGFLAARAVRVASSSGAAAPAQSAQAVPTSGTLYAPAVDEPAAANAETPTRTWRMAEVTTTSGLIYEDVRVGDGEQAKIGHTVTVHYTGWLTNGNKFDSSRDRQQPFEFDLGARMVIAGWDEGVQGMQVGSVRRLTIAPQLGYGARGAGGVIPPNSTLVFEVELLALR